MYALANALFCQYAIVDILLPFFAMIHLYKLNLKENHWIHKMHFSSQTVQISNICFVCQYVIFKSYFRVDETMSMFSTSLTSKAVYQKLSSEALTINRTYIIANISKRSVVMNMAFLCLKKIKNKK